MVLHPSHARPVFVQPLPLARRIPMLCFHPLKRTRGASRTAPREKRKKEKTGRTPPNNRQGLNLGHISLSATSAAASDQTGSQPRREHRSKNMEGACVPGGISTSKPWQPGRSLALKPGSYITCKMKMEPEKRASFPQKEISLAIPVISPQAANF